MCPRVTGNGKRTSRQDTPSPSREVDPGCYSDRTEEHPELKSLKDLPPRFREPVTDLGLDLRDRCRSGTYLQFDHSVLFARSMDEGLEVTSVTRAAQDPSLGGYIWRALSPGTDRFTELAVENPHHGYFFRALPGAKVGFPLQACLFMSNEGIAQNVHNIVVAEEGSELHIITGCGSAPGIRGGLHVGITEFFIKRGASVSYTMIHSWGPEMAVRPRSAAVVEEGGRFVSNFISLKPVRTVQMDPAVTCSGEGAVARLNSVLLAPSGTSLDVGGHVLLEKPGCRAEMISRAITTGGDIVVRGRMTATVPGVKGHLECRGLILGGGGTVRAIPELEGLARDVDLSHEAAVGRIAEEEITYLMARGLTGEEATSAIVRGFLDVRLEGLPESLAAQVKHAVDQADIGGL